MKPQELKPYDKTLVVVTMQDGTRRIGRLFATPEDGLYHVMRDPERAGRIEGGVLEDIWAENIRSIEPLR
jgi:hypothetical protein